VSQIPIQLIYLVTVAIATLATMGVGTLCASLFLHTYADPAILTALISLTSGLVGSLVTILSNPRTHPPGDTTTTTTATTTSPQTPIVNVPPEVIVANPPEHPANVTEVKTP
jgi:hypothetical protein